ncbi:MAG: sulfite reductase subunit alpha [Puniceicoccales bacterium]|jgi:sulfite reductase (NADPH) flavoprotein alpha-component|nr:sulfite reductase subunit alpha [Puniceicoccales bacterium]
MSHFAVSSYDKNNPFLARIAGRHRLTAAAGTKATAYIAIDISGSGLTYTCGDALGVYPTNDPKRVDALLQALHFDGTESVEIAPDNKTSAIRDALATHFMLSGVTKRFLQLAHDKATAPIEKAALAAVLAEPDPLAQKAWLEKCEFLDIIESVPSARFTPQEIVGQLRHLTPRLYSISSSPALHPQQIELTVAVVRYKTNDRVREGVCSTYLAERAPLGEPVLPVFVTPSHFAPPVDDAAPVIMVGPGAGIAPFRGFLQDRATRRASGKNWLFFGDQHEASDFLYKEELFAWRDSGVLTELSTAWSRDQEKKIYVQDRMRERGADVWRWLQEGAFFYICGDAARMAKDVDAALLSIIVTHGGKTPEDATEYLRQLRRDKRYQRDVY